jgi:2-aminoadipate transaminase
MAIGKQGSDLHSSNLSQIVVRNYIEKGYYYPNVEKSLPIYRERLDAMIAALDKYMPAEFTHTNPEGGLFIWGEFNAPINTGDIFLEAIGKNVAYIQGNVFFADQGPTNTIRLNFSNENLDRIETGVKILGDLFKQKIAEKGGK